MRRKAAEAEAAEQVGGEAPTPSRCSQTWAMLIKRGYEVDPLCCPKCQGEMSVIAFLEPPQADVIERILRHCGLWHSSRAPPADGDFVHDGDGQGDRDEPRELVYVAEDGTWAEDFARTLVHCIDVPDDSFIEEVNIWGTRQVKQMVVPF